MKLKKFPSIKALEAEIEAYQKITKKTYKTAESMPLHTIKEKQLKAANKMPAADNSSGTIKIFKSRKNYKELVNELNYPRGVGGPSPGIFNNQLDTWYKDPLYGRIDSKNNLIYHNYWVFIDIGSNSANPICVFDFVARAFKNMKKLFFERKLSKNSVFLSDLKAQNGLSSTINLEEEYEAHLNQVYQEFESTIGKELRSSKRIKNFDDFTHEFIRYCTNESKIITFSGFADTLNADIYDSYLAFDILPPNPNGSDQQKIDFLNDLNYPIYAYVAKKAGFFVDPNRPWRLIADVRSPAMINSMRIKYNQTLSFLKSEKFVNKVLSQPLDWDKRVIAKGSKPTNFTDWLFGIGDDKKYGVYIEDLNSFLYFIDFFRIELFDELGTFDEFKKLVLKYSDETVKKHGKLKAGDQLNKFVIYEEAMKLSAEDSKKLVDSGAGLPLDSFVQLFWLIVDELQKKRDLVNFTYDSLKRELKILKFSTGTPMTITTEKTYNSLYSSVYDYAYFTYFPLKLDEFYDTYIKKYPYFGTFHKFASLSHLNVNPLLLGTPRPMNGLNDIRLSKDLQNDFFDEKFLNLYIDLRLSEENKKVSNQIRLLIVTEVKEVYSKAVKFYENKNSEYANFRNICLKIVEGFIGLPYSNQEPLDAQAVKKKATMMAHEIYFNKNLIEPRIMTERLCCKLPVGVDILAEEPCPDFIAGLNVKDAKTAADQAAKAAAGPAAGPTAAADPCKNKPKAKHLGFKKDYWAAAGYIGGGKVPRKTGDVYVLDNKTYIFSSKKWYVFIPAVIGKVVPGKCYFVEDWQQVGSDMEHIGMIEECGDDKPIQDMPAYWKETTAICI